MVIDLKNCLVYFADGTTMTGAVNLMAGYMAGATTILVDGFTGQVPVGAMLSIDGVQWYFVVSTIETTGNTTSITFSPGLTGAVADNDVVIVQGIHLRVKVGEGNLTWSEKKPREYKLDRGLIDTVRNGDEQPIDVNFQFMYEELTASDPMMDPPTPEDVLKHRGAAEDWETSDQSDPCAPYCIDIRILHTPPNCTEVDQELVVLPKFYYEQLDHDPKAGTISCTGKCNATEAIVTRIPQV